MVLMKIQGGKEETENILDSNENMNTFYYKTVDQHRQKQNNNMWALLNESE